MKSPSLIPLLSLPLILATPAWAVAISGTITTSVSTTIISTTTVSTTALTSPTAAPLSDLLPEPFLIGGPRSLETTLTLATRHPQTLTAQARTAEARGGLKSARATRWFTVNGDAEAGGQFYKDEDADGTAGVGNLGLSLNQPLIDGGRRRGAVLSAEERLAGSTENLAWQQRLRRYTAAQAHINLWLAQELAQNNADNLNQLEQIVSEVQGRMGHGEATVTELAESQTRLATARAAQAERISALGNAQAAYLRDVGEEAATVANPGDGTLIQTGMLAATPVHPLISAAQHAVEEATGIVRQRSAGYWPTLDARARTSHNAFAGTSRTDAATQGQVTLNLGYTFIDHGVVAGDTAAAKANREAAESILKNTKLEIEASRINAQSNFTEAARRLEESERARSQSSKVIKNLANEVKQGNRTLRDLLDARRDELAASNAWAQAYANKALVGYDLERWQ